MIDWSFDWWVCLFVILRFCYSSLFSSCPTERSLKAVLKFQIRTRVSNRNFVAQNYAELCSIAWNYAELHWISLNCAKLKGSLALENLIRPWDVFYISMKKTKHKNKTICLKKVFVNKLCCFVFKKIKNVSLFWELSLISFLHLISFKGTVWSYFTNWHVRFTMIPIKTISKYQKSYFQSIKNNFIHPGSDSVNRLKLRL